VTLKRLEDFLNSIAAPVLAGCIFSRRLRLEAIERFLQADVITNVRFTVEEDFDEREC